MSDHFDDLSKYLDQPNEVSLETIALCNAACTFCPYPTLERKGEKMTDWLIDKALDEMGEFARPFYFSPFKVNEPLLDKRFYDICTRAPKKARIRVFTNGSPLTKKRISEIGSMDNVYHLWISLNDHRPEEYEKLMSLDFEKTAKRLDALHKEVDEERFPHNVVLSTVGFPNEAFRYYCFVRWPLFQSLAIQKSGWLGYTDPQVDVVPDTPCSRWWELSITSSGIVSLCCMDGEAAFPIGDINKQTLLEVYNAPQWRDRREGLLSRREVWPCSTCTY